MNNSFFIFNNANISNGFDEPPFITNGMLLNKVLYNEVFAIIYYMYIFIVREVGFLPYYLRYYLRGC